MSNAIDPKAKFRKYRVKAKSVTDFLDRYYKPDRFRGRGEEYAQGLIKSHQADLERHGYDIISHHDSVTGRAVAYYGSPNQSQMFPNGEDLPLFSGTAQRAQVELFAPKPTGKQKSFAACRVCLDTGRVAGHFCTCAAGQRARNQAKEQNAIQ